MRNSERLSQPGLHGIPAMKNSAWFYLCGHPVQVSRPLG
jgi:hypothetical protein